MEPPLPLAPRDRLPRRGISILEKLAKTCLVWLQRDLGPAEAASILSREGPGVSRAPGRWGVALGAAACTCPPASLPGLGGLFLRLGWLGVWALSGGAGLDP